MQQRTGNPRVINRGLTPFDHFARVRLEFGRPVACRTERNPEIEACRFHCARGVR